MKGVHPLPRASHPVDGMRFSREIFSSLVDQVMAIRLMAHSPPSAGICNESLTPPWDYKYTININTQMHY